MKKAILFIAILSALSLTACGDKTNFEFSFDDFYGYFFTNDTFVS
jgi:predicted small lipoprotein YifL